MLVKSGIASCYRQNNSSCFVIALVQIARTGSFAVLIGNGQYTTTGIGSSGGQRLKTTFILLIESGVADGNRANYG